MSMVSSLDQTVAKLEEKLAGRSQIGKVLREMGERMNGAKKGDGEKPS